MFSCETYSERRKALCSKMQGRGIILLPGHVESPVNYAGNAYRFRQDSSFLYFFGHSIPGLAGVIDTDTGQEWLFGDDFTIDDIIWMGPQPRISELAERVGVKNSVPLSSLVTAIDGAVAKGRPVHILPPYRAETKRLLAGLFGEEAKPSEELIRAVVSLRDKKSAEEIEQIEQACAIGYRMHTLAMSMCREGTPERAIAGAIEGVALQEGWGVSFHPIVSQHGETLHNHNHDGILTKGRLLLVDAGAEAVSNYCSDFTRTIPVGGRFTSKQKDIYDIVLAANEHAFTMAAPGVRFVDVHLASARVLVEGLRSLGLIRGGVEEALAEGVHALFMPHGLGHQMGLDVHDMEDLGENYVGYDSETTRSTHPATRACRMARRLEPGMVVTVEPGIYFIPDYIAKWRSEGKWDRFVDFARLESYLDFGGIRIEDDLLVTATGNCMLGERRIPASTADVEKAVLG